MNNGYFYTTIASFLLMASLVINEYLVKSINSRMLAFAFFIAVFFSSLVVAVYRTRGGYLKMVRSRWKDGLVVGCFNALAATFFFISLAFMDASTTAFLVRFSTIFIIIIGVFHLKEKLTRLDVVGMGIALVGAFIINFSVNQLVNLGMLSALASALFIALHQTSAKMFVKSTSAFNLVNLRALFSSMFLLLITFATSSFQVIPLNLIPLLIASGILGCTGFILFYKSLEKIEISKAAVIRSLDPFVVLIYSFLLFGLTPSVYKIVGGVLIVIGVGVIILKYRLKRMLLSLIKSG